MNEPSEATVCSTVSIIDFQMTVASLSVAEYALREEPYGRLPYLAGTIQIAQSQMECLRQEAMSLKRVIALARDASGDVLEADGGVLSRIRLREAVEQCNAVLNP